LNSRKPLPPSPPPRLPLGSTFYGQGHLWVVISNPAADGSVLMVNFTSWHEHVDNDKTCDETCIMEVGDHPSITHRTVVYYAKRRDVTAAHQEAMLKNPSLAPSGAPVSTELLRRIQEGALESDFVSERQKKAVAASLV